MKLDAKEWKIIKSAITALTHEEFEQYKFCTEEWLEKLRKKVAKLHKKAKQSKE